MSMVHVRTLTEQLITQATSREEMEVVAQGLINATLAITYTLANGDLSKALERASALVNNAALALQ